MSFLQNLWWIIDGWPAWAKLSLVAVLFPSLLVLAAILITPQRGRKD